MTEITQADHNVAEEHFNVWYPNTAWGYDALVDTLARHREQAAAEERAKIVAWLRDTASVSLSYGRLGKDLSAILEGRADAIEAGEHFTHPDNV